MCELFETNASFLMKQSTTGKLTFSIFEEFFASTDEIFVLGGRLGTIIIIIIELTHSKTILEITVEIEPQPATLDFKNLSQYSSCSK